MKRATISGLIIAAVLVGSILPASAVGSTFGTETSQVGDLDSDLVIIQADVGANGTAAFQIQYAILLADENETQAFAELAGDIEANESVYLGRFSDRMNATVESAESTTGRNMSVGDFGVSTNTTTLGKEYGLVTYTATWTGFAATSADQIRVGDALEGLFIDQDTRFQIHWADAYQLESVEPAPTSTAEGEVVWSGPREFGDNEPSVVLTPAPVGTEPGPTTTTAGPATTTATSTGTGIPWMVIGFGVVAIIFLVLVRSWLGEDSGIRSTETPMESGGAPGGAVTEQPEPTAELLSNEERVEQYLESVGGRAKQQEIVEALDWTEAKTSQVLSEMSDAESIEKFRIGRENVVKLPDFDEETE